MSETATKQTTETATDVIIENAETSGVTVNKEEIQVFIPKTIDFYEFPEHTDDVAMDIMRKKHVMLIGHTGCLSADTIINLHRSGRGFKSTIEHAYNQTNGIQVKGSRKWDLSKPTKIRSFLADENRIGLNDTVEFVESGIKKTYTLTLENGLSIRATANHEFLTDNGFIALNKLKPEMLIMCDTLKPSTSSGRKQKNRYQYFTGLKFHPFSAKFPTKAWKGKPDNRVANHRIIVEADMNGLSLEEYKTILKTGIGIEKLTFISPEDFAVHHKDENHLNNSLDNLEVLSHTEHWKEHGKEYGANFSQGVPVFSPIVSIEYYGEEMTYDIICADPHRNFVANGMVVHNSGKTSLIEQLAARLDQPCVKVNLNGQMSVSDLVGFYVARNGEMVWVDGVVPHCMKLGYWLILDEFDFGSTELLSILHSVTEKEPSLVLKEKGHEPVKVHDNFRIFATANAVGAMQGYRHLYQGTRPMNIATISRWQCYLTDYLEPKAEATVLQKTVNQALLQYMSKDEKAKGEAVLLSEDKLMPEGACVKLVQVAAECRKAFANEDVQFPFSFRMLADLGERLMLKKQIARKKNVKWSAEQYFHGAADIAIYSKVTPEDAEFVKGIISRVCLRREK